MRNTHGESEYDFTLLLEGIGQVDAASEDALFEAGCDDATISVRSGRVYLTFSRTAPSMKRAVLSAIRDVHAAQIDATVLRVDVSDLVSQADIARRLGRTRQLVNQYIAGTRGPGQFPAPACNVADGAHLWSWREVAGWLCENDIIKPDVLRAAQELAVINNVLELERQRQVDPALMKEIMKALSAR